MTGFLGQGWDDPKSQAIMALSAGLLGGSFRQGLLGANQAVSEAKQNAMKKQLFDMQMAKHQMEVEDAKTQREWRANLPSPEMLSSQNALAGGGGPTLANAARLQPVSPIQSLLHSGLKAGTVKVDDYLKALQPGESLFGKVDPKDYTKESLARFAVTRNHADLVPVRKREFVHGTAVDPYETAPGTVIPQQLPPTDARSDLLLPDGKGGFVPNIPLIGAKQSIAKAGKTDVHVNSGQRGLDNELSIHTKFRNEPIYKAHQEVQSAYSQITAALKLQSPAGDLAGATKIMKILDPGSVVRESELGMAMAASGALDRLQHYAANVLNGTKLTPKQRADFQNLADQLYAESGKQFNSKRAEYAGFATDYGLNADRIVGPAITSPRLPAPGAAAPGSLQDAARQELQRRGLK